MTNARLTKAAQEIVESRLSKYLSDDQLKGLNSAEIEILNDFYSNMDLRELKDVDAATIKKQISGSMEALDRSRLTNIPEDDYAASLRYLVETCDEVEEVVCPNCKNVIAVEVLKLDLDSRQYFGSPNRHWQGRFVIPVGNRLHGYRMRLDGIMGYNCGCVTKNPLYEPAMAEWKKVRTKAIKAWEAEQKRLKKELGKDYAPTYFEDIKQPTVTELAPCGNGNTIADIERECISEEHIKAGTITRDDIIKVKRRMDEIGYEKPVRKIEGGYQVEEFILRKVK